MDKIFELVSKLLKKVKKKNASTSSAEDTGKEVIIRTHETDFFDYEEPAFFVEDLDEKLASLEDFAQGEIIEENSLNDFER